jgi:chromosome partitioning protein
MAIKIAIANQKGGVGKTTTSINVADALKHFGFKVLFIDLDPQHNSTSTYGATIDGVNTIVDVLKKDCEIKEAIQHTQLGDIIAGDGILSQEEKYFDSQKARENLLKKQLKAVESEYDYVIMDTPPNLGIYMINALTAADGCVIPIKAEQYAVDGLGLLVDTINDVVEELNNNLKIYGVLLNVYDARNSLDKDINGILPEVGEKKGFKVFHTPIRISQDVKKVQSMSDVIKEDGSVIKANRSLFENYSMSNAAIDYVNVTKEIMEVANNG